jgi:hypothetical protein
MRCSLIVHSSLCLVPVMRLSEPTMNSCLPKASLRSVKNERLTGRTSKHSAIREGPDYCRATRPTPQPKQECNFQDCTT